VPAAARGFGADFEAVAVAAFLDGGFTMVLMRSFSPRLQSASGPCSGDA
jgi:hypothetical protein